jgi:ABC-type multidrug transport system ATPase subunit
VLAGGHGEAAGWAPGTRATNAFLVLCETLGAMQRRGGGRAGGWPALLLLVLLHALCAQVHSNGSSISWNISASSFSGSVERMVLDQVIGYAQPGRIHAILGPSGSGKTTLLNSLASEIPRGSLLLTGEVNVSQSYAPVFIQQQDLLFAQLTSQETLETSLDLKKALSSSERELIVSNTLNKLGLKKVALTKVGDAKTRGLSGGEKKRLDIGNELLESSSDSSYVFADEPTSGLDCFQAERIVRLLRNLADSGSTVIFSIHQPRASIYDLFQDISLLSEGRVIYSGPKEGLVPHFASLGYILPENVSPAEYFIDLVSIDYSSPEEEKASRERVQRLAKSFRELQAEKLEKQFVQSTAQEHSHSAIVPNKSRRGPLAIIGSALKSIQQSLRRFGVLYRRAWRQVSRDKSLFIARLASSLFSALLFGGIYFRMGNGVGSIADRLGLLQVAAVNCAMTSLIKATTSFATEKLIIQRERKKGLYGILPYFLAKMTAEIPLSSFFPCLFGLITYNLCGLNPAPGKLLRFLAVLVMEAIASTSLGMSVGALVPTAEAGVAIAPAVMVIFIVFGGLYVVNAPAYLQWVPNVSIIMYLYLYLYLPMIIYKQHICRFL